MHVELENRACKSRVHVEPNLTREELVRSQIETTYQRFTLRLLGPHLGFLPKRISAHLVNAQVVLVVVAALSYWSIITLESEPSPSLTPSLSPSTSMWTGTFSGSVDFPAPPDHFTAVYSGGFSFTVADDKTVSGSGTISKTYTISAWSCQTIQKTLTGRFTVSGSLNPSSNVVTFIFTVTQPSPAADESCSGIHEHIYAATDGFQGLSVTMALEPNAVSRPIAQLARIDPSLPDRITIRLQTATSVRTGSSQVTSQILQGEVTTPSVDTTSLVFWGGLSGAVGTAGYALWAKKRLRDETEWENRQRIAQDNYQRLEQVVKERGEVRQQLYGPFQEILEKTVPFLKVGRLGIELIIGKSTTLDWRGNRSDIPRWETMKKIEKEGIDELAGGMIKRYVREAYMTRYVFLENYDLAALSRGSIDTFSHAKARSAYSYNSFVDAVKGNILKWGWKIKP